MTDCNRDEKTGNNDIPPMGNINKGTSEFTLNSTVNNGVGNSSKENDDQKNIANNVEIVTKYIPPKCDKSKEPTTQPIRCSSKKNKNKKPRFDELIENLKFNATYLNMNFSKLLTFLESNDTEICFPFISKFHGDVFKMIAQDVHVLKSKSLDKNFRDISDKIIETVELNKAVYLLDCVNENREDIKNVLVMKKVYIQKEPADKESALDHSLENQQLPSESSSEDVDALLKRSNSPEIISVDFKTHCLRTTLAFVKNNETKQIDFPDLSAKQAEFLNLLHKSVVDFAVYDEIFENKELYTALREAVKIYSLKYNFKMTYVANSDEKKSLVFEKNPKNIPMKAVATNTKTSEHSGTVQKSEKLSSVNTKPKPASNTTPTMSWMPEALSKKAMRKMLKKQRKEEKMNVLLSGLTPTFVVNTLNSIIEFLSDNQRNQLSFVPNSQKEQRFYRKLLNWARNPQNRPKATSDYNYLFQQIKGLLAKTQCTLLKTRLCIVNEETGYKEVTYTKDLIINSKFSGYRIESKGKKNNLQNLLNLAKKTDYNIPVTSFNSSLRMQKKNKKRRCVGESSKSSKSGTGTPDSDDSDSDESSSRGGSLDRKKFINRPMLVANRVNARTRRDGEFHNKEKLIEAMSVPVQIDKAMKMMRGMGWSGGALGARGTGITEPIMPVMNRSKWAGLGHGTKETNNKTQTSYNWRTQNENKNPQNELPDADEQNPTQENDTTNKNRDWYPQKANFDEPGTSKSQTDTSKLDLIVQKTKKIIGIGPYDILQINEGKKLVLQLKYPSTLCSDLMHSLLGLWTTDAEELTIQYMTALSKKEGLFIKAAFEAFGSLSVTPEIAHNEMARRVLEKCKEMAGFVIKVCISKDKKLIFLKKIQMFTIAEMKVLTGRAVPEPDWVSPINRITNNEEMIKYIDRLGPVYNTQDSYESLWFNVLILLKILHFLKSLDHEMELIFNKVITGKYRKFIESTAEGVNSKFRGAGNSPTEMTLLLEIKKHAKGAFLGVLFNQHFTTVTLSKHYRCKRLNRPDRVLEEERRISTVHIHLNDMTFRDNNKANSTNVDLTSREEIDNGNVVIDNNDNQMIDIKRDAVIDNERIDAAKGDLSDRAEIEYLKLIDYKEYYTAEASAIQSTSNVDHANDGNEKIIDEIKEENEAVDDWVDINDADTFDYDDIETESSEENSIIDEPKNNIDEKNKEAAIDMIENLDASKDFDVPAKKVKLNNKTTRTVNQNGKVNDTVAQNDIDCSLERFKVMKNENLPVVGNTEQMDIDSKESIKVIDDVRATSSLGDGNNNVPIEVPAVKEHNFNIKTETDLDVSENNCYQTPSGVSHIVKQEVLDSPNNIYPEIKTVYIVPLKYPNEEITKEKATEIQKIIIENIVPSQGLPLLKCHGIQNGALIYTCHSKKTFDWIQNIINVASHLKVLDVGNVERMSLKLYCLTNLDSVTLFNLIEMYNQGISTKDWVVEKTDYRDDFVMFLVKMDKFSIDFIHGNNLTLFAGVDKVNFSLIFNQ